MIKALSSCLLMGCVLVAVGANADAQVEQEPVELIKRYVQAVGGEAKLRGCGGLKVVRHTEGHNLTADVHYEFSEESFYKGEKRLSFTVKKDKRSSGFNGKETWSEMSGRMTDAYPYKATDPIGWPLHLLSIQADLAIVTNDDPASQPLRVSVTPSPSEPQQRARNWPKELHFDRESGLLVKVIFRNKVVVLDDYREIAGIRIPFTTESKNRVGDLAIDFMSRIESIQTDVDLDDAMFEPPDTVVPR